MTEFFEPSTSELDFTGLTPGIFSNIEDTPEGFSVFFSMIAKGVDGEPLVLTKHGMDWIQTAYDAHDKGMGTVIMAFRGASKSVVASAFMAFRIAVSFMLTVKLNSVRVRLFHVHVELAIWSRVQLFRLFTESLTEAISSCIR